MNEPRGNPYIRDPELDFELAGELSDAEAREQAEELREAITYHDHRYYVEDDPVISDRAYDRLFDRLVELEEVFGLENSSSPTQRVGSGPLDSFETVDHTRPMLSLDSSADESAVREFHDRIVSRVGEVRYSVEPKFDGFSVELVYTDGTLDRAVTRGDGEQGEDVTANVRTIHTVPLRLPDAPSMLAVRAEIYMPEEGFQQLNEERVTAGKEPFANPRNAAAGTVRQLDPSVVASRPLRAYFYDLMVVEGREFGSQEEVFSFLQELGFRVNEYNRIVEDIDDFIAYREELLAKRDDLSYDIDGVVAKVDELSKREELGYTARYPRWAFAYKFPASTGETTVWRVVVQVGRTGKLTPVALLDPVDVGGVTIARATLHNEAQAREKGVGEGATVTVERAGDVIPEIAAVHEAADSTFSMPDACPVCGSEVVEEGEYHFCSGGMSCPAQLKRSLEHFCSRGAMDIEGVGAKVADALVDSGLVGSIADLYDLAASDLQELEGFGARSARKLLDEIEASREPDLASFIYGLGIRHVGKERARLLAGRYTLEELREVSPEELASVEDIGDVVAMSIGSFFDQEANQRVLDRLLEAGVSPVRGERSDRFSGLKLVFTGSIAGYTRDELEELMERNGASVTSAVSGETDYLIVGEGPGETKLEDAREHGVETMDVETFRDRFLSRVDH